MKRLFEFLQRRKTLWINFWATFIMTLIFGLIMQIWGFEIIDEMYDAATIIAHIDAMTPTQRTVHSWMTATLDVAYPLSYGALFIGMALRFFGKVGVWIALPSMLVIPVDLTEGVIQVFLLNGYSDIAYLKEIVTPLKLILFVWGLVVALIALGVGIYGKYRKSNKVNAQA